MEKYTGASQDVRGGAIPEPAADKGEHRDDEYDRMLDYLTELGEGRRSSIQELDKHTLTLASGAFGLSIALGQLMPKPLIALGLLRVGWCCLLGSIGATGLSLTLSTCSYWYLNHAVRRAHAEKRSWRKCEARELRYSTRFLTVLGPILFFAGMVYLAMFAFANLEGSDGRTNDSRDGCQEQSTPTRTDTTETETGATKTGATETGATKTHPSNHTGADATTNSRNQKR